MPHAEPACSSDVYMHAVQTIDTINTTIRRGAAQAMLLPEQPSPDTTNGVLSPDIAQAQAETDVVLERCSLFSPESNRALYHNQVLLHTLSEAPPKSATRPSSFSVIAPVLVLFF